jgi:hypothetical protein
MTTWFVEVPKLGGGWSPQLIHGDRPSNKGSEGASRRFRAEPVEIRPDHLELSLAELQLLYQPDEPPADISPRYIEGDVFDEPAYACRPVGDVEWMGQKVRDMSPEGMVQFIAQMDIQIGQLIEALGDEDVST